MVRIVFNSKLTVIFCWLAMLVFAWGCSLRYLPASIESPGRLKVNNLDSIYAQFDGLCNSEENVLPCNSEKPEKVGHVLGAYQEYTMKLTEKGPLPRKNSWLQKDAVTLMKTAFDEWKLDAVEFDVYADLKEKGENKVFILHYEPPWSRLSSWQESQMFINNRGNTLSALMNDFFSTYAYQGKRLYVELKAPKVCQDNGERPGQLCKDVVEPVAMQLTKQAENLMKYSGSVAFVSFSSQMLEAMYSSLDRELKKTVDFILILGPSNGIVAWLVSIPKGWVPDFDKDEIKWLKKTKWLDGVWYSPRAIKNLPNQISEINCQRIKNDKDTKCLFLGISVYQQKREDFMKSVRESWLNAQDNFSPCDYGKKKAPAVVRSFIFDIDSQ